MNYSGIGKRIKKYRDAAKMTQQQLAEATNYSIQHISHIENGQTKLSLKCLLSIASALQISVDQLVCTDVPSSSVVLDQEIQDLLKDCSPQEKQVLLETLKLMKSNLRKVRPDEK